MLSVCIPVYNYNIEKLLEKLNFLLQKTGFPYEIVVAEDGSEEHFKQQNRNKSVGIGARYLELPNNTGRSVVRNFLCREAVFGNLLFLDCDSWIDNDSFILMYKPYFNSGYVVYGGTEYQSSKPARDFRLHWQYGRKREIKKVSGRNLFPPQYFKTNNFLIPRHILLQYPFDEQIKGYGHEDTLMGITFSQNEIPVFHIDNPVVHLGLETNSIFISKTEDAVKNLMFISRVADKEMLLKHIVLLRVYSGIEKMNLSAIIIFFWKVSKPFLIWLMKWFFVMKALDFYKLGYLCYLNKKSTVLSNDAF